MLAWFPVDLVRAGEGPAHRLLRQDDGEPDRGHGPAACAPRATRRRAPGALPPSAVTTHSHRMPRPATQVGSERIRPRTGRRRSPPGVALGRSGYRRVTWGRRVLPGPAPIPAEVPCPARCVRSSSSTAYAPPSARPARRASTPRPAPTTSSCAASASCCAATRRCPPERIDEVAIAATTQIGDQGLTIGRTAALLAGLPKSVPGYAIDRMCAGAMTAVTTTRQRHRLRRLRRRDRRRRRAHGPPPDGRGRRPQPALHVGEDRRPAPRWSWARRPRTCTTASRT